MHIKISKREDFSTENVKEMNCVHCHEKAGKKVIMGDSKLVLFCISV
jgi:hypothetical protein